MKHFYRFIFPSVWPISVKFSVVLVAATLIPISFTTYSSLQQSLNRIEASEYRKLELLATSTASRIDQLIIDIGGIVNQSSLDSRIINFLVDKQDQSLQRLAEEALINLSQSNSGFASVFILDSKGKCIASSDPRLLNKNYGFREYFRKSIKGESYVSSILIGKTTKEPGIFFSKPVLSSTDNKILGIVVLKVRAEDIWSMVGSLKVGSQSNAFLIDQQGVVISHPDSDWLFKSLIPLSKTQQKAIIADQRYGSNEVKSLNIPELAKMINSQDTGHVNYSLSGNNSVYVVGFAPLKSEPWVLGIKQPRTEFIIPVNRLIAHIVIVVLLVAGVATILALFFARSIIKPIHLLTLAAQEIEQDNFDLHLLTELSYKQDDIGHLVKVFLQMSKKVEYREQKLKEQVIALRVEIDETKRNLQVAEITENEYFQSLQTKLKTLKARNENHSSEQSLIQK